MISPKTLFLAALPALSWAASLPTHTLSQLPHGTWLENIAVRPNGNLLVTQMFPSAIIYTIEHPSAGHHSLEPLVNIPEIQNIYGIAQVGVSSGFETYVVVGGNSTALANPIAGKFSAWTVTFVQTTCGDKVEVKKASDMNENSLFLNGVAYIPGVLNAVLVADSAAGIVGYLDLETGDYDISAFTVPEMVPKEGAPLPIGVNGIRIQDSYLYFTNSFLVSLFRIPITASGYPVEGAKAELVADLSKKASLLDDFDFDAEGNVYAATNFDNSVVYINVETGESKTVAGKKDKLTIAGSTAVAFGRGKHDKKTLYVSTSGALGAPVNGDKTEGSKVVAIDTRG
ncbi:Fc.00g101170.m01.CDS01 [Cosmosporella sp. VM-42]